MNQTIMALNEGFQKKYISPNRRRRLKESEDSYSPNHEKNFFNMQHDLYKALSDVAFKYAKMGIEFTSDEWDNAYEWWGDRFFITDFDGEY